MSRRILRLLIIYCSLILLFVIAKPIFMICNSDVYSQFSFGELFSSIIHGLRMDMSTAAYLTVIPAFMLVGGIWTSSRWPERIISIWRYIAVALIVLTVMSDSVLYGYWHFKLDTTPIFYFMTSPSAAMASVAWWLPAVALIVAVALTWAIGRLLGLLWNVSIPHVPDTRNKRIKSTVVMTLLTAALFIPIRGGFTVSTMNPSAAYFSDRQELNHAAVNPMFSLLYSATHQTNFSKEFRYFDSGHKSEILNHWKTTEEPSDSTLLRITDSERPDIYFIILESFSSHLVPYLGGKPVAVNLDWIAREGITMTNFYASSFRTDRAIPAILSGYPAQPSTSIMKFVDKTDNLPSIAKTLRDSLNYRTAYYYGGDIHFVNQKAYLVSSGFETIISDTDFPISQRMSKWGAHDDVVFDRMWADVSADTTDTRPVMRVLQTSSSHEPFEVPYEAPQFDNQRAVAFAFADHCLGEFMRKFKKSTKWDNALVIIVPDHWGAYPQGLTDPIERHSIPLVFTGGAVDQYAPMTLVMPASQSDIAATLLSILGLSTDEFPLSHNFLNTAQPQFAFFSEPDFAGVVTAADTTVISTRDESILLGGKTESVDLTKAFLQNLYDDISKR